MRPSWLAQVLAGPPLIAPARHLVLPVAVAGEEDALARGALWLEVVPSGGGRFLVQCALGFAGTGVATGVWATPHPDVLLAIAGGYAYRIDTREPESAALLSFRPVVAVHVADTAVVLQGFHSLYIQQADTAWETPRLSWEGIVVTDLCDEAVSGMGWHMRTDQELPFRVDLRTRTLTGGAFLP